MAAHFLFALAAGWVGARTAIPVRSLSRSSALVAPRGPITAGAATEAAYWQGTLFLSLKGSKGNATELALRVDLMEEVGYEPPQGYVRIDACPAYPEGGRTRWVLSEDPSERRDGFWIWGLFKEPLYPFMLFELELDAGCSLPDGRELPAGTYYLQGGHNGKGKGDGQGAALTAGTVSRRVPLDVPLVGANATYMEPFEVGSFVARQA